MSTRRTSVTPSPRSRRSGGTTTAAMGDSASDHRRPGQQQSAAASFVQLDRKTVPQLSGASQQTSHAEELRPVRRHDPDRPASPRGLTMHQIPRGPSEGTRGPAGLRMAFHLRPDFLRPESSQHARAPDDDHPPPPRHPGLDDSQRAWHSCARRARLRSLHGCASSGIAFTATVMHAIYAGRQQPADQDFFGLFDLNDSTRARWLADSDGWLWQARPTELPVRQEGERILHLFFLFTQRTFPVVHRPSFMGAVDHLYRLPDIGIGSFEILSQLYFALSIGYCFDLSRETEDRAHDQIRAFQTACHCHFRTLHMRIDGLMRLQTLALHSYALLTLRQRSESMRISAIANTVALEVGLHHQGPRFAGNPLETQMKRRVFWCIFTLHLSNSSLQGLPRALHEADITISEPSDIDDEYLTPTEVLNCVPGRTKIHRFISVCRLSRILSRALDVLYTHGKRKNASTKIEQMNRICCEHLLDSLDFSFEEQPDDLPDADSDDPADLAVLASWANEQLLYHYIRWLIHRPGLSLSPEDMQFAVCLQTSTDAAAALLRTCNEQKRILPFIEAVPSAHPLTIFVAALTPLFRTVTLRSRTSGSLAMMPSCVDDDLEACQNGISALAFQQGNKSDELRKTLLQQMYCSPTTQPLRHSLRPLAPKRQDSSTSASTQDSYPSPSGHPRPQHDPQMRGQDQHHGGQYPDPHNLMADYHVQATDPACMHTSASLTIFLLCSSYTAHDNLRQFVHEAFSPTADPWATWEGYSGPGPGSDTPQGHR
ncbi:Fungal specific transcription factor domain [Teratosphaeria destructans]|uniref:Fungal specific transcription factor domain n=1 Tax=Teratosphaeria destructans TaxID=418781 RepID=A0A9W7W007_9PEZI|nr:Fungal specific transcription factor domain [Teratosphaeria destructans]